MSTTVALMRSESFSAWLRRQLQLKDWSQAEFARKVGASTGVVNGWYHGRRRPEPESIDKIADVLGADIDTLLTLAGHRPEIEPIDPSDPRERLIAKIRRLRDEGMAYQAVEQTIDLYLQAQREARKARKAS